MAKIAAVCAVLALFAVVVAAQGGGGAGGANGATTYTSSAPFDWGRPCTLYGNTSATEITGPNNAACTACGSGATATPEPTCVFKSLTYKVGDTFYVKYHSSAHDLYLGASACDFKTEICPNATSDEVTAAKPCTYKFTTAGSYFVSDKAGASIGNGYCKDFGAYLPITVGSSS